MPAAVFNWEVEQGATSEITITYRGSDGLNVDLTGFQGRGQVREKMGSIDVLAHLIVTVENPVEGFVRIQLPATAFEGKRIKGSSHSDKMLAVYDVEIFNDVSGQVIRLLNGTMAISPEVTRA